MANSPAANTDGLPDYLGPLYEFSNGLQLPFGEVYAVEQLHRDEFPDGWGNFGFDGYFSYFLCHESHRPGLTSWDHESDTAIEGAYHDVAEWLEGEYHNFVDSYSECTIRVISIPEGLSKAKLVGYLKGIDDRSTPEWLALLRAGEFDLDDIRRSEAIAIVRSLQGDGVECQLVI